MPYLIYRWSPDEKFMCGFAPVFTAHRPPNPPIVSGCTEGGPLRGAEKCGQLHLQQTAYSWSSSPCWQIVTDVQINGYYSYICIGVGGDGYLKYVWVHDMKANWEEIPKYLLSCFKEGQQEMGRCGTAICICTCPCSLMWPLCIDRYTTCPPSRPPSPNKKKHSPSPVLPPHVFSSWASSTSSLICAIAVFIQLTRTDLPEIPL